MNIFDINTEEQEKEFRNKYPELSAFLGGHLNEHVLDPENPGEPYKNIDEVLPEYISFSSKETVEILVEQIKQLLKTYHTEEEIEKVFKIFWLGVVPTKQDYPTYRAWLEHLVEYFTKEAEKKTE